LGFDAPDDTAHDDAFIAVVLTDVAVLTGDHRRRCLARHDG
jgi:hypothetical protein